MNAAQPLFLFGRRRPAFFWSIPALPSGRADDQKRKFSTRTSLKNNPKQGAQARATPLLRCFCFRALALSNTIAAWAGVACSRAHAPIADRRGMPADTATARVCVCACVHARGRARARAWHPGLALYSSPAQTAEATTDVFRAQYGDHPPDNTWQHARRSRPAVPSPPSLRSLREDRRLASTHCTHTTAT